MPERGQTREQEYSPKIGINEPFRFLDPMFTTPDVRKGFVNFTSRRKLQVTIDNEPWYIDIELKTSSTGRTVNKRFYFTPDDPSLGYPLNPRIDFDAVNKAAYSAKLRRLAKETPGLDKTIVEADCPRTNILVFGHNPIFKSAISKETKEKIRAGLGQIHLVLSLSDGNSLESAPVLGHRKGALKRMSFLHFYPFDQGPLVYDEVLKSGGLFLNVPDQEEYLNEIAGQFILHKPRRVPGFIGVGQ